MVPPPTGVFPCGSSFASRRSLQEVTNGRFKRLKDGTHREIGEITDYEDLTTSDVVHQWVKLAEVTGTDRFADCASLVDLEEVGLPAYFVSHAWKGRFARLVKAVKNHLRNAPDHTRVWIDCFAVNQHQDTMPDVNKADVASFDATIQQCRGGTIVVVDMERCNPASRGWCLYEWDNTVLPWSQGLVMVGMTSKIANIVASVDIAHAECFNKAELAMIHSNIIRNYGSEEFRRGSEAYAVAESALVQGRLEQLARRLLTRSGTLTSCSGLPASKEMQLSPRCLVIADGAEKENRRYRRR